MFGEEKNGYTTIQFRRKLNTGDKYDVAIEDREMPVIVAFGSSDTLGYHGSNKAAITINFFTSTISDNVKNARVAHGVIMFLAWWVFLAFGIFAARFTKKILGKSLLCVTCHIYHTFYRSILLASTLVFPNCWFGTCCGWLCRCNHDEAR